jgi:transposase
MILLSEIIQYVKVSAIQRSHPEGVKPKMTGRKLRSGVHWQGALKQNWYKTRTKGTPSSLSSLILFCIASVEFRPWSTRGVLPTTWHHARNKPVSYLNYRTSSAFPLSAPHRHWSPLQLSAASRNSGRCSSPHVDEPRARLRRQAVSPSSGQCGRSPA